jgi:hypothetical protein
MFDYGVKRNPHKTSSGIQKLEKTSMLKGIPAWLVIDQLYNSGTKAQ